MSADTRVSAITRLEERLDIDALVAFLERRLDAVRERHQRAAVESALSKARAARAALIAVDVGSWPFLSNFLH